MMYVEVCVSGLIFFFFFQAEDGIRDVERSRGLGDVYKRQVMGCDGIYETMNSKEIVSFFYSEMEKNPEEKLSKHVENFLDKSLSPNFASTSGLGCDNMSCILIQFLHSTQ
eukprot:TRINITY_DN3170_c0_g1_i4.p1 TRINITY_DN3170_c0_g1~~TRINITY_DN3170_c0_g1_i4.p1  ORF type:complete len:111 (+),score=30.77 TRINITY_DN3170_c0_g1_i4:79-411(+)